MLRQAPPSSPWTGRFGWKPLGQLSALQTPKRNRDLDLFQLRPLLTQSAHLPKGMTFRPIRTGAGWCLVGSLPPGPRGSPAVPLTGGLGPVPWGPAPTRAALASSQLTRVLLVWDISAQRVFMFVKKLTASLRKLPPWQHPGRTTHLPAFDGQFRGPFQLCVPRALFRSPWLLVLFGQVVSVVPLLRPSRVLFGE